MLPNFHEHLYGYFPSRIFIEKYGKVFGKPFSRELLGRLVEKEGKNRSVEAVQSIFGKKALGFLKDKLGSGTSGLAETLSLMALGEICFLLSHFFQASENEILQQFLGFGSQSRKDIGAHKFNEDVRKRVFKSCLGGDKRGYLEFIEEVFLATLSEIPRDYRPLVAFSVPGDLFDSESLSMLGKIFFKMGSATEFYYSYPRYKLQESSENFERKIALIRKALSEGWAHGIDVTGSIEEARTERPVAYRSPHEEEKNYVRRFLALAETVSEKDGSTFKVHAFEGARTGPFYKAFWTFLEQLALGKRKTPSKIAMGHIAELASEDLDKFEKLRDQGRLPFVFDANIISNMVLQSKPAKELFVLLHELARRGFPVGFGGDGLGITGDYSFEYMEGLIKKHSNLSEADSLKKVLALRSCSVSVDWSRVA